MDIDNANLTHPGMISGKDLAINPTEGVGISYLDLLRENLEICLSFCQSLLKAFMYWIKFDHVSDVHFL